jgi:hypothetical protein
MLCTKERKGERVVLKSAYSNFPWCGKLGPNGGYGVAVALQLVELSVWVQLPVVTQRIIYLKGVGMTLIREYSLKYDENS